MKYRKLGNTNLEVSEIGFGSWGIGGLSGGATSYGKTDDVESKGALRRAYEQGVTFYDTSDLYGYGHSESLIGEVFENKRDKVVIASKVGFLEHNGPQDFSPEHIKKSVYGSLERLRSDYIDLYQLHSPQIEVFDQDHRIIDALSSLKKEGVIREYGISVRSPDDALIAVEKLGFSVVQVNFSLVDQRAVDNGLFKLCQDRGVGIICRTPLCFGFLSGKYSKDTNFSSDDHRSVWSQEQKKKWANAYKLFTITANESEKQTNAQIALRFCLSHPSVSSVIPGMLAEREVDENIAASNFKPFSEHEILKLRQIYRNNVFFCGKRCIPD